MENKLTMFFDSKIVINDPNKGKITPNAETDDLAFFTTKEDAFDACGNEAINLMYNGVEWVDSCMPEDNKLFENNGKQYQYLGFSYRVINDSTVKQKFFLFEV